MTDEEAWNAHPEVNRWNTLSPEVIFAFSLGRKSMAAEVSKWHKDQITRYKIQTGFDYGTAVILTHQSAAEHFSKI